jgi:hypothetical protein
MTTPTNRPSARFFMPLTLHTYHVKQRIKRHPLRTHNLMNQLPRRVFAALPHNHFGERWLEQQRLRPHTLKNIAVDPASLFDPDFVRIRERLDGRMWLDDG